MKVYELAKEMGLETIALMDKLRKWKVPVKSHMAALDDETVGSIKDRFKEEASAGKKKTTKTRKKAAPRAKKKAPATPTVVKSSTARKTTTAKASSTSAAKPKTKTKTAAGATKSRTVIRRKAGLAEPAPPTPATAEKTAPSVEAAETQIASTSEEVAAKSAATAEKAAPKATPAEKPRAKGDAMVVSRIDLRETMGSNAPGVKKPTPKVPGGAAATGSVHDSAKYDKETVEKLAQQETQKRKANQGGKEQKVETFIAADFKKRELLFQPKKKKVLVGRPALKTQITKPSAKKLRIKVEGGVTVAKLAQEMGVKAKVLLKQLIGMGSMVSLNDVLDIDTAQIIANEHGFEVENVAVSEDQLLTEKVNWGPEKTRPPVVTVMGHVDHGKTSLLDTIRKANVVKGEAGGITQHIGAYSVKVNGKQISFLDTPGHEAFTAMRARGASVTDIVILVVAADDGIMPQTREAIQHAKSAGVPIIVAVNKMDLAGADPQKILQSLTEFELVPEEWGGSTIVAKISALKNEGVKELLEMVLLQAEMLELKAPFEGPGQGTVVEARLDRGRGAVATVLVQKGTLKVGDILVAGLSKGRIRALTNDKGQKVKSATVGDPVEVIGLDGVPLAGDGFDIVSSDDVASELVEKRSSKQKQVAAKPKMTLEDLFAKSEEEEVKELNVLIKADVQGSAEALKDMLQKIPSDKVKVKVIAANVGGVSENDVLLSVASKAIIVGFNVRAESGVNKLADKEGVQIKFYSVIYEVVDDVKKAMTGLLKPTIVEKSLGRAEVRELFSVPKAGTIAGCSVLDGKIARQALVRLLRESRVIYEGKLSSLKRFKDDVKEVQTGFECGIGIENYNDLKVGDVIEAYMQESVAPTSL